MDKPRIKLNSKKTTSENLFSYLFDNIPGIPDPWKQSFFNSVDTAVAYEPVIGVMGKTGAGKSSLCNAIFKGDICQTNDVEACTREIKELKVNFNGRTLKIIDIPGVGESSSRDKEYEDLYRDLLPKLDIVIWVIKGDDRAFSSDEYFYKNVLEPAGGRAKTIFVINQADKIEPFREWDITNSLPSPSQLKNIKTKKDDITSRLGFTTHPIIAVSANEGYHIEELVETMIRALPSHAKSGVTSQLKEEYKSERIIEEAKDGFGDTVGNIVDSIIDIAPKPIASIAKLAKNLVVNTAKKVWGFFFR